MRRIVGRALLLTLVCVVTACGGEGIAERIIEESASSGGGGDVEVDIDEDDGTITVESEEGSASFSSGSQEMPDGFPVPVPDGGEVLTVFESSTPEGDGTAWAVTITYAGDDYESIVGFFDDEFDSYGDAQSFEVTGDTASTTIVSDSRHRSVSITRSEDVTQVVLTAEG